MSTYFARLKINEILRKTKFLEKDFKIFKKFSKILGEKFFKNYFPKCFCRELFKKLKNKVASGIDEVRLVIDAVSSLKFCNFHKV